MVATPFFVRDYFVFGFRHMRAYERKISSVCRRWFALRRAGARFLAGIFHVKEEIAVNQESHPKKQWPLYANKTMNMLASSLCILLFLYTISVEASDWTPRNRFWKHYQEAQEGLCDRFGTDAFDVIPDCLFDKLAKEGISEIPSQPDPVVTDIMSDPHLADKALAVGIANAISPQQARAVQILAECIRRELPTQFTTRNFAGGGNDCTYLNILLPLFLPSIAATVQHTAELAYEAADWSQQMRTIYNGTLPNVQTGEYLFPPGDLGIRSTEHLSYTTIKKIDGHRDDGSIYTVVFSLVDPNSFQGGEFFLQTYNGTYVFKPIQYSAIVFLSEEIHGVKQISSGVRETFATEYWPFDDTPWEQMRPRRSEEMELFTKRMEGVDNYASIQTESMWPTKYEVDAYLKEMGRDATRSEKEAY